MSDTLDAIFRLRDQVYKQPPTPWRRVILDYLNTAQSCPLSRPSIIVMVQGELATRRQRYIDDIRAGRA